MATIDDFKKLDIRVVRVDAAERVEGSEKLIKLNVSIGKNDAGEDETRQILGGIGMSYDPETLVDKLLLAIVNLEPRQMMGLESQGMILATGDEIENITLISPIKDVEPGSTIR